MSRIEFAKNSVKILAALQKYKRIVGRPTFGLLGIVSVMENSDRLYNLWYLQRKYEILGNYYEQ